MPGVTTAYQTGNHASRPAAGDGCILYACTTHSLVYRSDGSSWTTFLTLSGINTAADLPFVPAGSIAATDVQAAIEEVAAEAAGAGGSEDPIFDKFGAPTTAFEFDTSSLTGLTALGSPTTLDADTTVPDCLYIANGSGTAILGRYAAAPSAPFTAIAKVSDAAVVSGNFARLGGLFVAEATPGQVHYVSALHNNGWFWATAAHWSNPTTPTANLTGTDQGGDVQLPYYCAIVATSSTSFAFYVSKNGRVWYRRATAINPGYTVASVGLAVIVQSQAAAVAFDYLRIWDSALTLPFL